MSETFHILDKDTHYQLVAVAYRHRGYTDQEAADGARFCEMATTHGIRTHNAIKALHLDHLFGSATGGCVPGAIVRKIPSRFTASETWDAGRKLGQSVAFHAIERCIELAEQHGIGQVSVDNAFHYLWGGGYVMEAAKRGYFAYTNCTSTLAEVVPFKGKHPTMGTNPHSWGFPTTSAVGFPIVIDWATSVIAMGRVQQLKREGKPLPPNAAVDKNGQVTTDPHEAVALLPFGEHKGYALCLFNELVGGMIGGSLPTLRGKPMVYPDKKTTSSFYFSVIHPEAMSGHAFADGLSQAENLAAVIKDITGHGNESVMLPGQLEAEAAQRTEKAGGLLFSTAEIEALNEIATECGHPPIVIQDLPVFPL